MTKKENLVCKMALVCITYLFFFVYYIIIIIYIQLCSGKSVKKL